VKDESARKREYWLDDPANVRRIIWGLVGVCVLVVAADLFYEKDAHYGFQHWLGFDAVFGFASCMFLVLAAKQLRRILKRGEDYYD
jgi:hypothetical protein